MTSDRNCIGTVDDTREACLAEWRRTWSTNAGSEPTNPTHSEPSVADITTAGAGLVSAMMAHPLLVTGTVAPSGAGINRVVAIKAYAEARD